ncbi:MAG TPA: hypothetical protein VLA87_13555 [Gaiellaceae bacterium]|nr:hypothetical protein [Gaiellaceae bacterium]
MSTRRFQRAGWLALTVLLVGLVGEGATSAIAARPRPPVVHLGSAALLAPDGGSVSVEVIARCPERSTLVDASVTVAQPQATGRASFSVPCDDLLRPVRVTIVSSGAPFTLGEAQATATVTVERGKIQQAQDSEVLDVQPSVLVQLAGTALLQGGGEAVVIAVTVACPVGAIGLDSSDVGIGQDQPGGLAAGRATYVPTCDGQPHTLTITVPTTEGLFRAGSALATTFAAVEAGGDPFLGVDQKTIQIVT